MGLFDFLKLKRKTPEELLKINLEEQFEKAIKSALANNPMRGTIMEGMQPYNTVGTLVTQLKSKVSNISIESGLNEGVVVKIIDEVTSKILKRHFENFR